MFRFLRRLLLFVTASFVLAGGVYLSTESFRERWHGFVTGELAQHGVFLDFDHLTINPFGGLVARGVKVFNDSSKKLLIASVDRLNLDVDFGSLIEARVQIDALELLHANVALPVDPEHPEMTVVEMRDLSARAFLQGRQLDIRHAEGLLSGGLHISISGVVELPEPKRDQAGPSAQERLSMMREHRAQIQRGLDWLARFRAPHAPTLSVKVSGALDKPQELKAELLFQAQGLAFEDYLWKELVAEAEYDGGFIDLRRLHLQDHLGTLDGTATWHMGGEKLRFRLTSSADLPGLARAFFDIDQLREVVFYEAPQLALEGSLYVGKDKPEGFIPAEVTGRLDCGRFGSRGEIFNSLSLSLGANPEGIFVRDALLKHKTGTLGLDVMNHRELGFKYNLTLRMDPNVFLPFVQQQKTREIIQRFGFDDTSFIDVHLACAGPSPKLHDCPSSGHGVLRNFSYKGVPFESVELDLALFGDIQNYSNVRLRRADGPAEAELVFVNDDDDAKWLRLVNVRAEADAAGIVRAFAPKAADQIARYRFSTGTEVTVNGTLGYKNNPQFNNYKVAFKNAVGGAHYVLWNEDYPINAPYGDVRIVGDVLNFDIRGRLFGDTLRAKGAVNLAPNVTNYDVEVQAGRFPYEVFGEKLPFEDVRADVRNRDGNVRFDIAADVLGGAITLKGGLNEDREPNPYEGELRMSSISFQRFAQVYSPGNESEGDITGHFKFTGRMNDWKALKGGGALTILNGNLLALPVLGPLTPIIGAILPSPIKGYNVAKKADCTFEVADGFVVSENIEAESGAYRIFTRGNIDFIRDDIDFNAEVRLRGLGILLFPVTQLLAYKGSGTVGDAKWSPRIFGGGNKDERKPPTKEELREAQKIGGNPSQRMSEPPPPKRKPLFGK
ncbi:AsmA-like C-terminal region-containing protein [Prosthecobacter sp.]|uniref:AsmA-like C-terminal region-containing protein n=1 Tax=Prosthecobacter sp. TaxID=1965333 RepID=UPI001D29F413|nr:AsmA-like C-terminal region-containing protein [Prosthecobacter sp.]MCB1275881.1 hypothetical protein [Prosthecobacter sp.]